ncbi:Fic family protein, partial [Candidatus Woesearchaeota archaeon]|nr:Fic family protein [Candidatus Woesearchaeota archaeon]
MHIEKRDSGKKIKYFLSHSYREGKKVHKFRKYLGRDLKEGKLKERKEIAEKLILEEIHRYKIVKDPLCFKLSEKEIKDITSLENAIPFKISHLCDKDWKNFSE